MVSNQIIAGSELHSFSLDIQRAGISLLPLSHELIVNTRSGHYVLVDWERRFVVADGVFARYGELPLALALLGAWPSMVENQKLLLIVTDQPLHEIAAILDSSPDSALEPLRRLVQTCQVQFQQCGIEIARVECFGYKLAAAKGAQS